MKPVSIIIPTLNEERYLPQLLDSIFLCTKGKELQIIVVDAHSEDGTLQIVGHYRNNAPIGITLESVISSNRNISIQRNLGVEQARHETIIFLDADTRIPSAKEFDALISLFYEGAYSSASCCFTAIERDWKGKLIYFVWTQFTRLMQYCSPNVLGACIITTRTVFQRCGGFDPTITIGEDANYCLRSLKFGRFRILPVQMEVSARRFRKHGYGAMTWEYCKIFLHRTLFGEYRSVRTKRYDFGKFNDI